MLGVIVQSESQKVDASAGFVVFQPSWACLGPAWGHLGNTAGPSWAISGHLKAYCSFFGPSWGQDARREDKYNL